MTAPDEQNTEPKSPFADVPSEPRKFERRAWVVLVSTIVLLLTGLATPNAIFIYRIQRIVDHGGYVRSRADYFGEDASAKLGSRFYMFYQEHFYIRDEYEVFLGNTNRAVDACGSGISLSEAADDDVHRDPGDEGPKLARALGRISRLSLAETSVTDQGLAPLAGMTTIKNLDLSSTRIKGPGLAHLHGLDLQVLSLNGNAIDDDGFAYLPHFAALKSLDIGKTRASTGFLSRLNSFTHIEDLDLEGLPITDEMIRQLVPLRLWRLNLQNTPITDAALSHLETMPGLMDLNLCGTKVTLARARSSEHRAIRSWVSLRELIFAPGKCEVY